MAIDYVVVTFEFERHLKNMEYKEALSLYYYADRPFWLTEEVGRYYERQGLVSKAMNEYQYLVDHYLGIRPDFLPLPNGPVELFKLGRWYAKKDKGKARKYLRLYLSAEDKCGGDSAFYLKYKNEAIKLLNNMKITKNGRQ